MNSSPLYVIRLTWQVALNLPEEGQFLVWKLYYYWWKVNDNNCINLILALPVGQNVVTYLNKGQTKVLFALAAGLVTRALSRVHQSMFISICCCINIFSDHFLSSNFYYTSIISRRTKSGRIHLNKTNVAAIIENQVNASLTYYSVKNYIVPVI